MEPERSEVPSPTAPAAGDYFTPVGPVVELEPWAGSVASTLARVAAYAYYSVARTRNVLQPIPEEFRAGYEAIGGQLADEGDRITRTFAAQDAELRGLALRPWYVSLARTEAGQFVGEKLMTPDAVLARRNLLVTAAIVLSLVWLGTLPTLRFLAEGLEGKAERMWPLIALALAYLVVHFWITAYPAFLTAVATWKSVHVPLSLIGGQLTRSALAGRELRNVLHSRRLFIAFPEQTTVSGEALLANTGVDLLAAMDIAAGDARRGARNLRTWCACRMLAEFGVPLALGWFALGASLMLCFWWSVGWPELAFLAATFMSAGWLVMRRIGRGLMPPESVLSRVMAVVGLRRRRLAK